MTTTNSGLDPEVRDHLAKIATPITWMEHVSRGRHLRGRHTVYCADRVLTKLREGNPMGPPGTHGDDQFLAAFLPVRHGKTTFFGMYLVTWLMGVFPGIKILFVTYSDDRARKWGSDARDLMKEWGPSMFGVTVRSDRESGQFWATSSGSEMRSVGMGGQITGEGFHVVVVDDTIKDPIEADSPTTKRQQVEWYYETLLNRMEPGGLMLFTVARWREDDLPGQVCWAASEDDDDVDDWEIIRFPALAEAPEPDDDSPEDWPEQWRDEIGRKDGEALWPEYWSAKRLRRKKANLLTRGQQSTWDALYQQNPTPKEGGSFKVDKWRYAGILPDLRVTCRAWDLSASLRKGDWTVGVKMGLGPDNEVYILNVVRDRLDPAGVQNLVVLTAHQDGYECLIAMEEEKGASGKSNSATFQQKLLGYQFHPEPVVGKKEARANSYAAHQGNGYVYIVKDGMWDTDAFVEEHRTFPNGRHDDQVDAASLAFRTLALGGFGPVVVEMVFPDDDMTPLMRRAMERAEVG